jgi:hypothetical protein
MHTLRHSRPETLRWALETYLRHCKSTRRFAFLDDANLLGELSQR